MTQEFTITIFSENVVGIMSRVIGIITRRKINAESISASKSSIPGIHKITIVINQPESEIIKVVAQIDKQIDVLKSFYFDNSELVYQELALYKIPKEVFYNGDSTETLIRNHNARILTIESDYIVIEKTGHRHETETLLNDLQEKGIYEFVRSGKICVAKPMEVLNTYLKNKGIVAKN